MSTSELAGRQGSRSESTVCQIPKPSKETIAVDARTLGRGRSGFGRYVKYLVDYLPETLPDHHFLFVLSSRSSFNLKASLPGCRFIHLLDRMSPVADQLELALRLRAEDISLCHFTTIVGSVFLQCPSVVTIHDTRQISESMRRISRISPSDMALRLYQRFAVPVIARRAKAVMTDDAATKEELVTRWRVPQEKVEDVILGVDEGFHPMDPTEVGNELV